MIKPIYELEPLMESLQEIGIEEYIKTRDFKNAISLSDYKEIWLHSFKYFKERYFRKAEHFEDYYVFYYLLNSSFKDQKYLIYNISYLIAEGIVEWKKEPINLWKIVQDLNAINCPSEILDALCELEHKYRSDGVHSLLDIAVNDSEKLKNYIQQIDETIASKKYGLTLTYAYTTLEGLFKGFIIEVSPNEPLEKDLLALSKQTKQIIIDRFKQNNTEYPEQIINLITTITNAVANSRNQFSESHFDKTAEKWLAEFARDSTNTIGRLILNLMNQFQINSF